MQEEKKAHNLGVSGRFESLSFSLDFTNPSAFDIVT